MYIFDIIWPGTWLDYEDQQWAFMVRNQLSTLQSQYFEANLALNLFLQAQSSQSSQLSQDQWEKNSAHRARIRKEVESHISGTCSPERQEEISLETEIRFKREKWSSGSLPKEFKHNLPFVYAKTFLYALDTFGKLLGTLAEDTNAPPQLTDIQQRFSKAFSHLRGVRNTAQHMEDRSRGLGAGKNPKPLELKPLMNDAINAPNGGVLILNGLIGSRYGNTMSDGHYGEVDVSPESMKILQGILNEVLNSFKWHGPKHHYPSA